MSRHVHATVTHRRTRTPVQVDPVAVELALKGRRPRLHPPEMRQVVDILTRDGWSAARIAEHIGTTDRAIQRNRARLRQAP